MKPCFKCGVVKPLEEFYRHPQMGDGHLGKCKDCARRDVQANRRAKIDYYREYDRLRAMAPHRLEARAEYLRTEAGRRAKRNALRNSRRRFPEKDRARLKFHRALRKGLVQRQPCEVCGEPKTHGHHVDYAQPLVVRWLCALHHAQAHGRALKVA